MRSELIKEEWRPVVGYAGLYEVSNFGRVRSLNYNHTGKTKILKLFKKENSYLQVRLCKEGKKMFYVHRLVYEAFNGEIPEGYEINHINEDKTDNSVWNLNLMTHFDNMHWGTQITRRSDPVLQLTLNNELVREWPSTIEAGRHGFNQGAVSACCLGKLKYHKGFKWVKKNLV